MSIFHPERFIELILLIAVFLAINKNALKKVYFLFYGDDFEKILYLCKLINYGATKHNKIETYLKW